MSNRLCFQCFKLKGDYEVCPYCGYGQGEKAKQAYQLASGTILHDRYIIGVSIGIGGFGITYKAYDTVLGIIVAIKEFYPARLVNRGEGEVKVGIFSGEKETEFKRQLARFLEEARNMAEFSKEPDIINVFDYFEENQTAYIIMEYVDAPLLKDRLKEAGRFSQEEAAGYMVAILNALSKVHGHGIIHKDISPDNIFLTGEDTVKIFDFGAAKFQGAETERSEDVVVKAGYTPPEQYRSKNEQGPFMDIYAAGAVFYEMVTGEKPMEAPDRSVSDDLKKPGEYGIEIDERLERVILKALALKPKLRFQTADQFRQAIESEKKVELPEEELKRLRVRKILLSSAACAALAVLGLVVILSQTVFSGRGKIDVAKIQEDSLEIWMPEVDEAWGKTVSDALLNGVEKECPKITVTVKTFPKEEYAQALEQAAAAGKLPEVFCTDGIQAKEYCEELSRLFRTMKLSSYICFDGYESGKDVFEIPTALQVGAVYVSREKMQKTPESVKLSDLSAEEDAAGYADEENIYEKFADLKTDVSQIVGDLSCMDQVKAVTVEQMPPTDFAIVPILEDGELVAAYAHCYGVNKEATENQKEAGMLLLSLLLSDGLQSACYMDNGEGIPLNRSVLETYRDNKMTTYLAFLKEYSLEDVKLLNGGELCERIREEIAEDKK